MRIWRGRRAGELVLERMEERTEQAELQFGGRTPVGPALLAAPFFAALVVVAWDGPLLSPARAVTGGVLLATTVGLIIWGWPTKRTVRIRAADGTVDDGAAVRPLMKAKCIDLQSGERLGPAAVTYRADLVFRDGGRVVLLEGHEPARVLRDLANVLAEVNLPVTAGWRLPPQAEPWRFETAPGNDAETCPASSDIKMCVPLEPNQHNVAFTLFIGAILVCVIVAFMFLSRLEEGKSISSLSFWLVVPLVGIMLLLSGWMYFHHLRFSIQGALVVERRVLTLTLERTVVPLQTIRNAFALGPEQGELRHLLIQTRDQLLSFACPGDAAKRLAEQLNLRP